MSMGQYPINEILRAYISVPKNSLTDLPLSNPSFGSIISVINHINRKLIKIYLICPYIVF